MISNITQPIVAEKVGLLQGLFIPTIQFLFYICFFGGLAFIVIRAILILWKQKYKFKLKYLRKDYKKEDLEWIVEQSKSMDLSQIRMKMLVNNYSNDRINEIMFIYNEIERKSGGSLKKQRTIDGNNRDIGEKELPTI